jgi:hypothetical protein
VLKLRRGYSSEQQRLCMRQSHYSVLTTQYYKESRSSVWLEHYTDNVGVSSSNLLGTTAAQAAVWRKELGVRLQTEHSGLTTQL